MADPAPRRGVGELAEGLATGTSRRGLLARVGQALVGGSAAGLVAKVVRPGEADAARVSPYNFCGHIYTTGSCPHPTGLPRIDHDGYPLRARDGHPVDDLGRPVDRHGRPVGAHGSPLTDPDGHPLPVAPRTKVCAAVGRDLRLRAPHRRLLVSLLRRPCAQARRLLRLHAEAHQPRRRADRLLLRRAQGVLRHLLRDADPVLSGAAIALGVAALAAGLTGTWSPCGFSMIDTLGPRGHDGGRRATMAACAAFALGAPLGGAITFGGLSALGALLQGGGAALGLAAAIAVVAAALDLAGVRVAPQLRRQVPEGWRRVLPLPLAGFLYGILLGLGFTTYVLSFALPALAAISVAAADVRLGLVVGVAFGVGRALPIVVLAPLADTSFGGRAITAMAQRPGLLRGTRVLDALALAGVAAALVAAPAQAATRPVARPATQPSVDGGALAWSVPGADGRLAAPGAAAVDAGGRLPAIGEGHLAVIAADGTPLVIDRASGAATPVPAAAGADALAVSARWLAWRLPRPDRLLVLDLATPGATPRPVVSASGAGTLSRPTLSGDRLAWGTATTRGSAIRSLDLATPGARAVTLRRAGRQVLVSAPALLGGVLVWLRASALHQELRLGAARPRRADSGRVLLRLRGVAGRDGGRDPGYTTQGVRPEDRHGPTPAARYRLLDTALDAAAAYVSRVPSRGGAPSVVAVPR